MSNPYQKVEFSAGVEAPISEPITAFADHTAQQAAMADPRYGTSQAYRDHVAARIALSSQIADGETAHQRTQLEEVVGSAVEAGVARSMGDEYNLVTDFTAVLSTSYEVTRAMQLRDEQGNVRYDVDPRFRANVRAAVSRGDGFRHNSQQGRRGTVRHTVTHEAHQANLEALEAEKAAKRVAASKPLTIGE